MKSIKTIDAQQAVGFVLSQTSHIETKVNKVKRPEIQYSRLVPVDTSAGAFSKSVTYFSHDQFGKAEWVNGNAGDVPLSGTERSKFEVQIYTAAIGYGYGFEEIGLAQQLGETLPADDALAARRAYEEFVDELALFGDATKGFEGLLTGSLVPVSAPTHGDWGNPARTEDEILQDFNEAILGVATATGYVAMANTVLLPYEKMNLLATSRLGDTSMTILEFIRKNNTYTAMTGQPLAIFAVRRLETAGAGGVTRMVAYNRHPDTLRIHIPMPHRFLQAEKQGVFSVVVPGVFRVGGVNWRLPKEARYVDGI